MRQALWPDSGAEEVDGLLGAGGASPYAGAPFVVLVADSGDGLTGFAEVSERPFAEGCESGPVAYLEGIWVDASQRRGGLATALLDGALEWAQNRGLTELASDTSEENHVSQRFHLDRGFEEAARVVCFRMPIPRSFEDPS